GLPFFRRDLLRQGLFSDVAFKLGDGCLNIRRFSDEAHFDAVGHMEVRLFSKVLDSAHDVTGVALAEEFSGDLGLQNYYDTLRGLDLRVPFAFIERLVSDFD